ncbi:RagB/SusD family nutrient uptake outer membrane protein [Niastella caeni]|uniref:RagB/SusD family nutrient uptake outer membrane protein n=1 Tax=Niastella caeni TaxID=2569763 RepID=A0A4S8HL87_9BACT|nr:RagB/SusD family nutrient uptake outer membrane protein [Niastella caeni]THU36058.1 RagB/SusD family nutrient uptake outer membrane protein [Niastella caeni]
MLKKISIYVFCLFTLLTGVSCNKWLDLQPQDGITNTEFWKSKEQVQAAVTGVYASLLASTSGRPLTETFFLWGELRADHLSATPNASFDEVDVMNVNILPTNSIANWRNLYQTINYCNSVIAFAPKVLQLDQTFTQDALNRAIAEVKTIRALLYFYLVRSFGEVPLKLSATASDQELEQLPKSSQQEVLNQILTDLSEAETNTVLTYGNTAADKGRITRYTVFALQADVYLWMDRYADCIAACDKVINSGRFGLVDETSASVYYRNLYVNGNSNEGIFEIQFDEQKQNTFYNLFLGNRRFMSNPLVMEDLYMVDYVNADNKDFRGDGASVRTTDGAIWKYVGWNYTTARGSSESYAHWIVYRFADILLMKAEALNQLDKGEEALALVRIIRNRARALIETEQNPDPSDKRAIADYILEERAREFAYEGKRWYDLLRNAKRNNYERLDILLNLVANTVTPDRQQSAIAKFKDKNSHYFPIYFYELTTDKNLEQNPFYK